MTRHDAISRLVWLAAGLPDAELRMLLEVAEAQAASRQEGPRVLTPAEVLREVTGCVSDHCSQVSASSNSASNGPASSARPRGRSRPTQAVAASLSVGGPKRIGA